MKTEWYWVKKIENAGEYYIIIAEDISHITYGFKLRRNMFGTIKNRLPNKDDQVRWIKNEYGRIIGYERYEYDGL